MLVENGKQRQPDAGLLGGLNNAQRKLRRVGIGFAAGLVVQIVELADRSVTGLEHLHLHVGGDGLDMLGRQLFQKPVHQLAPGPEGVAWVGAAALRQSRHSALECVAVQIGGRG